MSKDPLIYLQIDGRFAVSIALVLAVVTFSSGALLLLPRNNQKTSLKRVFAGWGLVGISLLLVVGIRTLLV